MPADARGGAAAVAAGRAGGAPSAVVQAQAALAQAVGRTMAGQMTAGGAAMALAQAQWALRASRLGDGAVAAGADRMASARSPELAQRAGRAGLADGVAMGARQRPDAMQAAMQGSGQGRVADGRRAEARGAEGPVVRPGQLAPAMGATVGDAVAREDGAAERRARSGDAADLPHAMAMALALAPKVRRRASQDRVERVERDMPRHGAPELEDEDLLDAWGDGDGDGGDGADGSDAEAGTDGAQAAADVSREAAAQHYRALWVWLQANAQHVLLRELEAGRCVLVLAPPDVSHMRLWGHVLRPDGAGAGVAAGSAGLAWPLMARWSATMPADTQWRVWRLRQELDAAGRWGLGASRPDRHTPLLVVNGAAAESAAGGPGASERIALQEPRRLRRLLGSQWTLVALRVPVPLDGTGAAGQAVA